MFANLLVKPGCVTENFNRTWYERNNGHRVTKLRKYSQIVLTLLGRKTNHQIGVGSLLQKLAKG